MWRSSTLRALHCQQQVPVFVLSCSLPWALLPPAMTSQFIRRLCRKLFCNFHASSCSMYHWVERLQSHKVKFCFGLFPWRKKNGTSFQGHQCLSLVWLTSLIWQALLPRCYSWQRLSAELCLTRSGSGLVQCLKWAGERPSGLMEAISFGWLSWKVA